MLSKIRSLLQKGFQQVVQLFQTNQRQIRVGFVLSCKKTQKNDSQSLILKLNNFFFRSHVPRFENRRQRKCRKFAVVRLVMVFLVVLSYRSTLIHICILCILQNFPSNSDTAHHVKSKLNMCPTRRTLKERLKNEIPTTLPTTYQSSLAVRSGKKSPNQETGLGTRGQLRVLNDTKLTLNY